MITASIGLGDGPIGPTVQHYSGTEAKIPKPTTSICHFEEPSKGNMSNDPGTTLATVFDVSTLETVFDGAISYVSRAVLLNSDPPRVVALKSASTLRKFSKQPHDILKEANVLATLSHPNIIEFLGSMYEHTGVIHFWMPFVQNSLHEVLASTRFSPYIFPTLDPSPDVNSFIAVARSLAFQLMSALEYLHASEIAHRDIKPRNVLITSEGCLKLIDFGISWDAQFTPSPEALWPEPRDNMCPQICSGPYRAPETIFGPTQYDPFAVDLWSAGVVCAEFFTSLRFVEDEADLEDEFAEEDETRPVPPFVMPEDFASREGYWSRDALFDAERGSIGLAWSIFKIRGSPTEANWPTFSELPDASKVTFQEAQPVDLRRFLPNLPGDDPPISAVSHFPPEEPTECALDLIHRLLVYPPDKRLSAKDALQHPWLRAGPLLLPPDYNSTQADASPTPPNPAQKTLGELIQDCLRSTSGASTTHAEEYT